MSFLLSNNNNYSPPFNHREIGQEFCKYYYNTFSSCGLNGIAHLYHPEAKITFLEEECVGIIEYNQKLSNIGLPLLSFNNLIGTTQPHNNDTIIISVNGDCCVSNGFRNNNWGKFSDVFVITLFNGNWVIIHHIFKVIA
jgi:hypothetical protein